MTTKNLGPGISGYLDPTYRAWETTVYQAGKPVLDKELNLIQDSAQEAVQKLRQRAMPSGWLSKDFLATSAATSPIFTASAIANELNTPQPLLAHVNGWLVVVWNTGSNTVNLLDLGAGPAGAGTKRFDLVILEVWRKLLSPSPSTDGKSGSGRIWYSGNVRIAPADDLTLNFADDILDGSLGSESTKRVQIQYRLRVIQGVDILAFPLAMDDPTVVANSVPASAAAPDGVVTLFPYTNATDLGDPGLWVAGDGNPANTLGTVDGYMYALPLMAVVRRNTSAFDRNTNHNGGVASPGPSDRPDGLFYDIIADKDIIDLRTGVAEPGWDYQDVLAKNFHFLLDNTLQTETTQTAIGGGVTGVTHLWADEIGITNAHGGDGTTTGDTPGAMFIGEFDAIRRRFSDRVVHETIVVKYTPADGSGGGPNWANGDVITIDPTALPVYGYSAFNWASYAPADVMIYSVVKAEFIAQAGSTASQDADQGVFTVSGLGAIPMTSVTFTIDTVPGGITTEELYLRLEIVYPTGVGLTKTPVADFGSASLSINNPGQMPAGAPVLFEAVNGFAIEAPHREATITYNTVTQTFTQLADFSGNDYVRMPERVLSVSSILINAVAYGGTITISADGYTVTLDPGAISFGDTIDVDYKALRPFPQNDEQVTVYYDTRAPQTLKDGLLGSSQTFIPRYICPFLYSLSVGSGSQDTAYPYESQYVQMPGIYPSSGGTFSGEHEFSAGGGMTLSTTGFQTGFLKLETKIPLTPDPQSFSLTRVPGDIDAEGRAYFKTVPAGYIPNAWAEPLRDAKRHRCVIPILCELPGDTLFGKRGEMVMVVLETYLAPDISGGASELNTVLFLSSLTSNITSASIYRLKGNLLNSRSL